MEDFDNLLAKQGYGAIGESDSGTKSFLREPREREEHRHVVSVSHHKNRPTGWTHTANSKHTHGDTYQELSQHLSKMHSRQHQEVLNVRVNPTQFTEEQAEELVSRGPAGLQFSSYEPHIARDTKEPLVVLGGYKIKKGGGIHHDEIPKADTTGFKATHHDTLLNKKVQVTKTEHGHAFLDEHGGSGHDPGPLSSRYKPL